MKTTRTTERAIHAEDPLLEQGHRTRFVSEAIFVGRADDSAQADSFERGDSTRVSKINNNRRSD